MSTLNILFPLSLNDRPKFFLWQDANSRQGIYLRRQNDQTSQDRYSANVHVQTNGNKAEPPQTRRTWHWILPRLPGSLAFDRGGRGLVSEFPADFSPTALSQKMLENSDTNSRALALSAILKYAASPWAPANGPDSRGGFHLSHYNAFHLQQLAI